MAEKEEQKFSFMTTSGGVKDIKTKYNLLTFTWSEISLFVNTIE